jgi:hypothetical protein
MAPYQYEVDANLGGDTRITLPLISPVIGTPDKVSLSLFHIRTLLNMSLELAAMHRDQRSLEEIYQMAEKMDRYWSELGIKWLSREQEERQNAYTGRD